MQKVSVFLFGGQPLTTSCETSGLGYVAEAKDVTLEILCVDRRKFLSGELVESCGWCTGVPVCW